MRPSRALILSALCTLPGCATLQQVLALRNVDFSLDRVSNARLANVDLSRVASFGDLSVSETGRLLAAVSRRDLPLDFDVHVTAFNPEENSVDARLVRMEWMLLLQGEETVSGTFADETVLPRGQPTDVPISVSLNLIDFFEGSAQDLVELAFALVGGGGEPTEVTLRATPTVDSALGPITYPQPITIVSRRVGG